MNRKTLITILIILFFGILYRLTITEKGSFLFNMDNARDMVDVREMMVLHKLRLIGPTSAIEGLFNGPAWYYLLAIPFAVTQGDPYGSIIMEIVLWVIGGFFLLKLVSKWGTLFVLPVGVLWVASNYIVLTNLYAFNPNPVTLLTPLFIYLLVEYLRAGKAIFIISTFILGGLFFNFEMNFGVFTPVIIFASIIFSRKTNLLKNKWFWIGFVAFILTLLPQIIFDVRHQFIMSKSVIKFLTENKGSGFNLLKRINGISEIFYNTFSATMMNQKFLSWGILLLLLPILKKFFRDKKKDILVLVSLLYILIPFIGYLIIPVGVNPWHLGGPMSSGLILIAFLLFSLWRYNFSGKIFTVILSIAIIFYGTVNVSNFFLKDKTEQKLDPSLYKNELLAIDYVYGLANGANFKVYTYLPSVYDYPYQYLFWWYGKKKYGYIPGEYAYSPNKPPYIPSQDKFSGRKDNLSGLVFLIKEPDRIKMRQAWENDYKDMEFISKKTLGEIEIEVRKEVK